MPADPADVSYAETAPVTCPACGHGFEFDVWLIVDAAGRPDLLARIREGTLHDVTCPACGQEIGRADAPLLLFLRPSPATSGGGAGGGGRPPLLFSPAERTSSEQDRQQAMELVRLLRQRLGDAWQDAWLAEGLPNVPRALLPAALSDDPEAELRRMAEQAAAELERLRQEDPETFARLEEAAREALEPPPQPSPYQGEGAGRGSELPQELEQTLRDLLAELAASGAEIRTPDDLERVLADRPDLAERLEAAARAMGAGSGPNVPPEFADDLRQAQEAEERYLRTGDRSALDAAAAAWERILRHPAFPGSDERFQLAAMNDAGGVFLRRYWAAGRLADLNRALELWQQAVGRTPADHPDLPGFLNNLGTGLRDRYARTGALADLEEAIGAYRQAVGRTPADHPDLPSRLNNLGTGLRARYARTGALADLEQAVGHWERAVALTPAGSPDLPMYLNNLALGLRDRYARTDQLADLKKAIGHWEGALGRLHAVVRVEEQAAALAGQAAAINRRLVAAHLQRRDPAAALAAAENGRGVRLRLDLARSGRVPAGLGPAEQEAYRALWQEARELASQRRGLDPQRLPPAEHAARLAELARRSAEVNARLDALEARDPDFAVRPLDYPAMAGLAREHDLTLVFLQPTDEAEMGCLAFVVTPTPALPLQGGGSTPTPALPLQGGGGGEGVLRLPGLGRAELHDLLFRLPEGRKWGLELLQQTVSPAEVGWLAAYRLTHLARRTEHERQARELWRAVMLRVLDELAGRLAPLAERLAQLGARRVVIIPGDRLGLLPLHAVLTLTPALPQSGGTPTPALPLSGGGGGEGVEISYAPSATALKRCLARGDGPPAAAATLVAIANPDGSLVFADDEVRRIARHFDGRGRVAFGPAARRDWLLQHAGEADYLELSTHASFAPGAPEHSALLLAHPDGYTAPLWLADLATHRQPLGLLQEGCERLSLDDLWAGRLPLKEGCVVSLDACETGQIEPGEEADESLGFPAAFLSAGARAVIASLWAVDDFSTSLLMERAYELMLGVGGAPLRPAAALREAAAWLRTLPLAEVLARLDAVIASLRAEKAAGEWQRLARAERAQRLYALSGLEYRRQTLAEEGADPPFAHPVWWAAFAAYGA